MNTTHKSIDTLLRQQFFSDPSCNNDIVMHYAECIAIIEKAIVVVSDLKDGWSRIFHGGFSDTLGLEGVATEASIWEKEILERMSPAEQEEKYLAELRFFNFLRHIPRSKRDSYYLATHLRMTGRTGNIADVLHRMHYWYEDGSDAIRFGICIYGPMSFSLPSKSVVIDSLTGRWQELSSKCDDTILSIREKQVLALIDKGLLSREIAQRLCISKNTVSRHRQEILAKLQVRNSTEACRKAKLLGIIN